MSRTYTCDACGETYTSGWTDEEAAAEAAAAFSAEELYDPATVCDPCWREMRAAIPDLDARYPDGAP